MNTIKTIEQMVEAMEKFRYHLANNYEINAAIQAGRELLEELKGQEPVAWMQDSIELYVQDRPSEYYTIPLYTHQQPKEPLTDEQTERAAMTLAACMDYPWTPMSEEGKREMRNHAKAVIEAAHGIGKE